ncbi:hypothetical protein SISSUDRAFT_66337 [Sistotremastrum suecicum HHB10207 ss-3]|uniref:Uncharacterized protein n=1 Tax=Sistotremastrum suecicum HHB10207 ss-3 TaxID=1314776 RepID=A0A166BJ90_9AGAM|nr:hypothetical protein SISSUDRAFT_66337 [Sistotremastrum suecicum HHB10207 ss-3]
MSPSQVQTRSTPSQISNARFASISISISAWRSGIIHLPIFPDICRTSPPLFPCPLSSPFSFLFRNAENSRGFDFGSSCLKILCLYIWVGLLGYGRVNQNLDRSDWNNVLTLLLSSSPEDFPLTSCPCSSTRKARTGQTGRKSIEMNIKHETFIHSHVHVHVYISFLNLINKDMYVLVRLRVEY